MWLALPLDALLETYVSKGKWRAQGDDYRTFLGDFVASLPQFDFLGALSL